MLVLTRKPNQQLHIGNDIVITIVKVRGNTIRLGIEAPKDVRVIRSELEPKSLEPKSLEPKPLEPKSLEPKSLERKPLERKSELEAKSAANKSGSQANASASQSDVPASGDAAASADDAQEAARAQPNSSAPLIFKARIQRPAPAGAPLKRFAATATVKRSHGGFAERNIEDCPLCHLAPPASKKPQSTLALTLEA